MDWRFPWASSGGSDFNSDFGVWFSDEQQRLGGVEYNYRREPPAPEPMPSRNIEEWQQGGSDEPIMQNRRHDRYRCAHLCPRPGRASAPSSSSTGAVYHSYSSYARGLDGLWGVYQWLDRAPKGRNETGIWWRHHDRYGKE